MKIFTVYDSKYGNTKQVAQQILEGINEVDGFETDIGYVKEVSQQTLAEYDAIVVGAPNHMGNPSRTISKFINSLQKTAPKAKWVAVFDTYYAKPKNYGKAMKKMESTLNKKASNLKLIMPGLSIKVEDVSGPIAEGELPKAREFGHKIATQLKT